jgi:predicted extracellular nuclease
LAAEFTALSFRQNRLRVASYNVFNLDPSDGDARFAALASQITSNLRAPEIVALQEVQDSNGEINDGTLDATATYQALIDAIVAKGGPAYAFAEISPPTANADGGVGNIRVGYLYDPERVTLKPGSLMRHGDGLPAFDSSRKPLEATFVFNGKEVVLINNHFASKVSGPPFGAQPPPVDPNEGIRNNQAAFVNSRVDAILALDPAAKVVVLGDLNSFSFDPPHDILVGGASPVLFDLDELIDPTDRYTSVFLGNSDQLDHILASASLIGSAEFDAVHVNSGFATFASDHDPILASFLIEIPEPSTFVLIVVGVLIASHSQRPVKRASMKSAMLVHTLHRSMTKYGRHSSMTKYWRTSRN